MKRLKLFAVNSNFREYHPIDSTPLPKMRTSAQHLKDKIFSACKKELLKLLLEDQDTLIPIPNNLIKIIDQFLADEQKHQYINPWTATCLTLHDQHQSLPKKTKEKKNPIPSIDFKNIFFHQKTFKIIDPYQFHSQKHSLIKHSGFFGYKQRNELNIIFQPQINLNHGHMADQNNINIFAHQYQDILRNIIRLLRRNLTIVRFLLVLFDNKGTRLIPLTQENVLVICHSIRDHEENLQNNADRLDRLFYLCSQSKKFSDEVTNWMRMYQQHCTANDISISFPELLLTYCANHPEYVDDRGPLSLQTLCAKILRDDRRQHQIPYAHVRDIVNEENIQPNGIGDDEMVVRLLTELVAPPTERQHLRLGM